MYATVLKYTENIDMVVMSAPKITQSTKIELLGYSGDIRWSFNEGIILDLSKLRYNGETAQWGLTFKISNLA